MALVGSGTGSGSTASSMPGCPLAKTFSAPRSAGATASAAPHIPQNFIPTGFEPPQLVHFLGFSVTPLRYRPKTGFFQWHLREVASKSLLADPHRSPNQGLGTLADTSPLSMLSCPRSFVAVTT